MALANKPITESDLEELITNQTAEGKSIEYKVSLSLSSDEEKKEFLADISSFANTAGGYVVYGMKEDKGLVGCKNLIRQKIGLKRWQTDHP